MEFDLIERPSVTLAIVARALVYATTFNCLCAVWLAVEIIGFGRFEPKFGAFGTFVAELLMSSVATLGALLVLFVTRRGGRRLGAIAVHAFFAAIVALTLWKIDRAYFAIYHFVSLFTGEGHLVPLFLAIGIVAGGLSELFLSAITIGFRRKGSTMR